MSLVKYRLKEVAADFGVAPKEISQIIEKYYEKPKSNSQVLSEAELNAVFDHITRTNQISSLQVVFDVPKPEPKPEIKPEVKQEIKSEVKQENKPVVLTGRLSLREDKEPQIVINRARPMSDFEENNLHTADFKPAGPRQGKLYLRLPTEEGKLFHKIRAILNMFPGECQVVVYFADTKQRRGSRCSLDSRIIPELEQVLGKENVVIK